MLAYKDVAIKYFILSKMMIRDHDCVLNDSLLVFIE